MPMTNFPVCVDVGVSKVNRQMREMMVPDYCKHGSHEVQHLPLP